MLHDTIVNPRHVAGIAFPLERAVSHTTGGRDGREEGRERGY